MPLSADEIKKLQAKAQQLRCDMVDVTVWAGGAHIGGLHASDGFNGFRRILSARDEARPGLEISQIAALMHKGFIDEALGHDDMGERVDHGDV